ncbi:enoyl-CoA hydratase/isomerase family protein [Nocardioides mangrovicus]|uniref:Enoyl-CoA hydratase/isomerase family protein n=1 Tax=Nocardioides mangrovicus TaxID=2478913 RepID=A0A3L8P801_9ACTN|nr:enoyl-CoA hydratase-related protein [Nocardioides mangrovicus]RLV50923.1 enoyl-CoA hydratase/isomerase family protein [Nocardioides mangrovicus]
MSELLYEVRDGAAWITINRPEARNALNTAVREGLKDAFERAEADPAVSVVVLTGAGDKAFCAGGDLKEMASASLTIPPPDYVPQPNRTLPMTKPVVAAVNGGAFGGGFLLAQSADLVVAAEHAKLGISEIKIGRGAPWAAPLPWLVPPRIAMQMLVTGEPLTAQRAYEVGLVNEVVPADELLSRTEALVAAIVACAPLSVRAGKATVYAAAQHGRDAAFDAAEQIWEPVYLSEDAQEGPRAFAEKRRPVWQGR